MSHATSYRPRLSFWQIINMNVGFFGIQFSFGLQQSSMSPIYTYLGADEASLPYLWLAGPMTGLIVQPLIGAMSDRTVTRWGRRTPYFLIGAILCSLGLLAMPFSPTLWMAASLLWILDAANNVTMEPYRAFVSDKLDPKQHSLGFLTQSAFTGLGQTLAYLTPSLLVMFGMNKDAVNASHIPHIVIVAFLIGAVFSLASVLWTLKTTPENPLDCQRAGGDPQPRAGLAPYPGRYRHSAARDAADDEAAGRRQIVPVVRHVLLLAVHFAVPGRQRVPYHRPGLARVSRRGSPERADRRVL